ncbi:MAG TPA: efflux RND transporter periplasmic adaptor subunit, partial [Isosphaeraceae bacterium]|nr:efflux RND transporter periplasmic adaptor subunit [Isosphaeraceae bacterium]
PNRFGGSNTPQIEEGAQVRERQKIFSLPDITKMQVNTKVHESMVDRVARGQRARIRVDALPNGELTGSVKTVAPLPDPSSFFSSDIKVYSTLVSIDKGPSQLRPGMTAQVEILVTELEDVLSVPVQAVLEFKNKQQVYVKTPNGYERRQVTVGISNDQLIEVKTGIKEGDRVVLNPTGLMTEDEKREAFGTTGQGDGKSKDWGKAVAKEGGAPGIPGAPGGPAGKGKGKGKGRGKGQRGNFDPAVMEKLKNASPEERQKMIEEFKAANPGGFGGGGFGPGGGGGEGGGGGGGFGGGGGNRGPQGGASQ